MIQRPIFQMCLDIHDSEKGWVFPGERDESEVTAPVFTIAWRRGISMEQVAYFMPGEIKGDPTLFVFMPTSKGTRLTLQHHEARINLALDLESGAGHGKGLRYIGERWDVLESYGKSDVHDFVAVVPTDIKELDQLYVKHHVVLVGVTPAFGRQYAF